MSEGVENRVVNKITPGKRISRPYWNPVALREAVINAIIHDYSSELVPKFEVFSDRLEITSAGAIHTGQEQEDFFAGYSNPRNKALMRVFKDLELVEYLGSGMPRILKAYPRTAYTFSSHFIRTAFPISKDAQALEKEVTGEQATGKATGKTAEIIIQLCIDNPSISIPEMAEKLSLTEDGTDYHIRKLRSLNLLKRVGGRKAGHWDVIRQKELNSCKTKSSRVGR